MGFIDRPSADTTVAASTPVWAVAQASVRDCHIPNVFRSCRSSRLQRFPPQRADPKTRPFDSLRVCCTPQPAMGFTTFRTPWSASRPSLDPKVVDLTVQGESSSVADTLRSVPLLDSLRPCRHRVSSFRTRPRTPAGVPSRRSERCSLPCRHGALLCSPTSGLSSVEESVAAARRFRCAPARCSLGLWIDSFPMLPRVSRRPDVAGRFALRAIRFGVPDPNVEGRQGVSALSGSVRPTVGLPRGEDRVRSRWLRHLPKEAPRPHPTWAPKESVGCQWIRPERKLHRVGRAPEGARCRRNRDASPKRLVRDPVLAPKNGTGGSSSCSPSFRGRPRT
jgi:hypothetical protein